MGRGSRDRACWWGCSDVALQGLMSVGGGKGGGWQALGWRTLGKVMVPQRPGPAWTGQWTSQGVGRDRGHRRAGRVAGEGEGVHRPHARRGLGTPEGEGVKAPEFFCRVGWGREGPGSTLSGSSGGQVLRELWGRVGPWAQHRVSALVHPATCFPVLPQAIGQRRRDFAATAGLRNSSPVRSRPQ